MGAEGSVWGRISGVCMPPLYHEGPYRVQSPPFSVGGLGAQGFNECLQINLKPKSL